MLVNNAIELDGEEPLTVCFLPGLLLHTVLLLRAEVCVCSPVLVAAFGGPCNICKAS